MEKRTGNRWGVIIGVIVLIFASLLFSGGSSSNPGGAADGGSTYNTHPEGLSAIYAVLHQKGQARRWEKEPKQLPASVDRLVLWQPDTIKDDGWKALLDWTAKGHTLIIASSDSRVPGSIWQREAGMAQSAAASPLTMRLGQVSVGASAFATVQDGAMSLLTTEDGAPVLITYPQGKGRIYWSADPEWLSNARIDQADNLWLALQLLAPNDGLETAFSEYHHGIVASEAWWQMLRGSLRWFGIVLALATAVLFWAYGARFGAPVPVAERPSRASVEYVYSMSQLYRRAGARSVVLGSLYRSLTRDLSRLLGGTEGLSHAEVARRTAERTGLPAERVQAALDRTGPGAPAALPEKELILLTREVEAIQRSVHNAGFHDQHRPGAGAR